MTVEDRPALRQLSTKLVYENPYMRVVEDEIERLDGSRGLYSVIEKPDFALVLPYENNGFWLIEQFRYPVRVRSWEFPQGTFGQGKTGTAEELAATELAEETGFTAGRLESLGYLNCAIGMTGQGFRVFLATELTHGEPHREIEEQDMRQQWFARADLEKLIRTGGITDDSTVAAYGLWLLQQQPPSH